MKFKVLPIVVGILGALPCALFAQLRPPIAINPTPGAEVTLAVADALPATDNPSAELSGLTQTFNQVLFDDLDFSGFFTIPGKSFYPRQGRVKSEADVLFDAWAASSLKATYMSIGTLELSGGLVTAEMRIFDMQQRKQIFGKKITGDTDQIRTISHQWADIVVYQLTAGASKGIASTKIAYSVKSGRTDEITDEIYIADYDGYNAFAFTRNGSQNLFPSWSPDSSKLAFISKRTNQWEINLYSFIDGSRIPFQVFNAFASTPVISPDGGKIIFTLSTPGVDTDLFISNLDGSDRRNITNNPAIDTSPTWAPSGRQIAFSSDRGGRASQIYICDSDGSNVRRIVKEGGDADSPAWSPDGRYLAFHWKPRMTSYYDLFLAEVSSGRISQLTAETGSNESPSWAPDGRHLVFQSNRTGSNQIYIMRLDGSGMRRITNQGDNNGPSWSGYR